MQVLSSGRVHPSTLPSGTLGILGHSCLLFTFQPSTVTCTHTEITFWLQPREPVGGGASRAGAGPQQIPPTEPPRCSGAHESKRELVKRWLLGYAG